MTKAVKGVIIASAVWFWVTGCLLALGLFGYLGTAMSNSFNYLIALFG